MFVGDTLGTCVGKTDGNDVGTVVGLSDGMFDG